MKRWRLAPLGLAFLALFVFTGKAHADYVEGNFVNDQMFLDNTAMNQTDIQNFLTSEGAGIASMDFTYSTTSGTDTLPNGTHGSAAYIIWYASQHIGISPRTIMATLQKEQSLITTPSPSSSQINYAMGYGCPDSGGCSYPGFYQQVMDGAWQLRFNAERAGGNTSYWMSPDNTQWGAPTIAYPCPSGSTTFYTTNSASGKSGLYPGNTVTWLASGSAYTTSTIANKSSAAMYCYTPHAYKSGVYSGSYNFVKDWELWWGESTPSYASAYAGESTGNVTLLPGQNATVSITYKNNGNMPWYDDNTATANGSLPVHLATSHSINRHSLFGSTWGGDHNRAASVFSSVTQSNGTVYGTNPHVVQPGESGTFTFTLTDTLSVPPGTYNEFFQPIVEGGTSIDDPWTFITVNAQIPTYSSAYAGQSGYPTIQQGHSANAYIRYKNTGNMPWYDDVTAGGAGVLPVHLATTHAINRHSIFGSAWGGDQNRTGGLFGKVYESDGVTLASNQHAAQPGQVVEFDFTLTAGLNSPAPGTYREFFQPLVEGGTTMNDPWTFIDISVTPATFTSAYAGQSGYPSIQQGQNADVWLKYKNTGNMPWYDDSTAGANNTLPVHLATSHAINRHSGFGLTWGGDQNRTGGLFGKVYESDGATLASNQHVAQPGQVVEWDFIMTADVHTITPGTHREFFQPIVEGGTTMNDPWTFLDINVTQANFSSAFAGQSAYPTVNRGSSTSAFLEYKNTGNAPWYDVTSVPRGDEPVVLATSHTINRASVLADTSGGNWCSNPYKNRASCVFGAVYESDGVTPAANQHVAQPGQIVKFNFDFAAAASTPTGTYREFFQPIVEGVTTMNDPWTFLDVIIK